MNTENQIFIKIFGTQSKKKVYHVAILVIYCLLFLIPHFISSQTEYHPFNLGSKSIFNFPKTEYQGATQSWDISEDERGYLYFANNDGLLEFDGQSWSVYKVANQTIVRSIACQSGGRIYAGAQNELGYFEPDASGCLKYQSLLAFLPKDLPIEDVWDIVIRGKEVFFRTNRYVLVYDGDKQIKAVYKGATLFLGTTSKHLILQKSDFSLWQWAKGAWQPLSPSFELPGLVTSVLQMEGDTTLFTTLKNGIYYHTPTGGARWETPYTETLQQKRIYHASLTRDHKLALGTSLDGVILLDARGRWHHSYHKQNGLIHNNVLCTYIDKQGNLWVALDNGIAAIQLSSPFSTIIPNKELGSTGYAMAIHQNKLYLGQSDGLYSLPWKDHYQMQEIEKFTKVAQSDGQVWGLSSLGSDLWMGHHEGLFRILNNNSRVYGAGLGAWTVISLDENHLLEGGYDGLMVYQKKDNEWQRFFKINGLNESCRIAIKDDANQIWVSHPYRGVYKVSFDDKDRKKVKIDHFTAANGLPSDLNNYVFNIAGKAVIGTEKGVYRFDTSKSRFVPAVDFNQSLGDKVRVKYLKEDQEGNIWFAAGAEVGLLKIDDLGLEKKAKKIIFPELERKLVGGFESIYPYNQDHVFFATETGFMHYGPGKKAEAALKLHFSKIMGKGDTLLVGSRHPSFGADSKKELSFAYEYNDLTFYFSSTGISHKDLIDYRCLLTGYDDGWSAWSREGRKQYSRLRPGKYTLQVQARIRGDRQMKEIQCQFTILPPWYLSGYALFLYVLVGLGGLVALMRYQYRRFEKEKQKIQDEYREEQEKQALQVEQAKAALVQMQNEKLATDIAFKNQELASATMHLVQKGEVLHTIKQALDQILEKSPRPEVRKEIQGLINLMNFDNKIDEDWEQFSHHFDQVHVNFMERLRKKYPQITANDEKLCAYLRLNLSTKETAQMMNISVRGVEASRYRLRKKLGLSNEENLVEFMMRV